VPVAKCSLVIEGGTAGDTIPDGPPTEPDLSGRRPMNCRGQFAARVAAALVESRSLRAVVGSFLGDHHIVNVAFAQTLRRDATKAGFGSEVLYGGGAGVAHSGAKPSDELIDRRGDGASIGHATLDAFGYELLVGGAALSIAILRAALHGAERAHSPVDLVAAA